MSRYPEYRQSRQSFGINVLGTLVVEIEAEDGTIGFAVTLPHPTPLGWDALALELVSEPVQLTGTLLWIRGVGHPPLERTRRGRGVQRPSSARIPASAASG